MKTLLYRPALIVLVLFFSWCILSCSENPAKPKDSGDDQWINYTTSDGLPDNSIGAIAFGPDGDTWCVPLSEGGAGIAHFDGNTWKQYTTNDGLASNAILWMENTLTISTEGVLWVATFGGGVSSFDGQTWSTYTTADGLRSNNVTAVAIAPNGDLFCAHPMPDGGISLFDGDNWTAYNTADIGVSSCNLTTLVFDQDGSLWAGGGVVLRYNDQSWTGFSSETGMQQPIALYMDIGPDGRVWIAGNGLSCYDGTTWTHFTAKEMGINGEQGDLIPLAVDSENVVWVGLSGYGIYQYDGNNWKKFTPENGPDLTNVFSITVGPGGSLWFGTDKGISCYMPEE